MSRRTSERPRLPAAIARRTARSPRPAPGRARSCARSGSTTGPSWCPPTLMPSPGVRSPYTTPSPPSMPWWMKLGHSPVVTRGEVDDLLLGHVQVRQRTLPRRDPVRPRARGDHRELRDDLEIGVQAPRHDAAALLVNGRRPGREVDRGAVGRGSVLQAHATVSSARHRPASGWYSAARSKAIPGQRSWAASGESSSLAAPLASSAPRTASIVAGSPWSSPPVVSSRGTPASSSSSRHSGSASCASATYSASGYARPEDARSPVAAPSHVALLELLEEDDVTARAGRATTRPTTPSRRRRSRRRRSRRLRHADECGRPLRPRRARRSGRPKSAHTAPMRRSPRAERSGGAGVGARRR